MKGVADCRVSTGLVSHPKKLKLQRRLGKPAVWSLIALWSFTASNKPDGSLAGMTSEDIAIAADWDGDADQFVNTLLELRFLDGDAGDLRVHDWSENNPWAAGATKRSEAARAAAMTKHHGASAQRMPDASEPHADRSAESSEKAAERMPDACDAQAEIPNPQCPASVSVSASVSNSVTASEALPFPDPKDPTSSASEGDQFSSENAVRKPNVFDRGIALLKAAGEKEGSARNFIGKLCADFGEPAVLHAIETAEQKDQPPVNPKAWLREVASKPACSFPAKRKSTAVLGDQPHESGWGAAA